jgi:uncharacterized cupredoxin-like copper-binding protein
VSIRPWIRAASILAVLVAIALCGAPPTTAQTRRVIHVTMTSFKFDPNLFFVNDGDTVVLQLENVSPDKRAHAFNSPYLSQVNYTMTGDYKEGVAKDGTKYVQLESGQKAEMTFVAKGPGQYGFACNLYNHAAKGQTGVFVVWPAGYHPPAKTP